MLKVLKESTIRLAGNWSAYKSFGWTINDLKIYEETMELQESLNVVNKSITYKTRRPTSKQLIKALLELFNYSRLKRAIKREVGKYGDAKIYCDLGYLFLNLEELLEAKKAFQRSIEIEQNANSYQGLGWVMLKLENKALSHIKLSASGIHSLPSYTNSYQSIGYASIGDKSNRSAKEAFYKSLKLKEDWECLQDLGLSYLQINQYGAAIDALKKSISLNNNWKTYYAYGMAHHKLKINGRSDQTISAYRKAVELNPHWRIYYDLGRTLEYTNQFEEAIIAYEQSIELTEKVPRSVYYHLGSVYCKTNQYSKAIKSLQKSNKIKENYRSFRELGWAFLELSDYKAAKVAFKKSIKMNKHWSAYRGLGNVMFKLGKYGKAKKALMKSARLEKAKNGIASCNLAWIFFNLKDYDAAIIEFKNSIDINQSSEAYRGLGSSLLKSKEYTKAKVALEKSLELKKNWKSYRDYGWSLFYLKDYDLAIEAFKNSISMNSNSSAQEGQERSCEELNKNDLNNQVD